MCDGCDPHLHHAALYEKVPLHELYPREEDDNLCFEHYHCDGILRLYDHEDSKIIIVFNCQLSILFLIVLQ